MTTALDFAQIYDLETFPNVFTAVFEEWASGKVWVYEISMRRDDRAALFAHIEYMRRYQVHGITFNGFHFDYPVLHWLIKHPNATVAEIYQFAMTIINGANKWETTIFDQDHFFPQIDLFKIYHFDNKAKMTSLKALQINMRLARVVESKLKFGTFLTPDDIDRHLIPYNRHDVTSTKEFAKLSRNAIEFRLSLVATMGQGVLNFNDTKIGEKILETKIGPEICFYRDENGRKQKRQTPRDSVALRDIIFPYIRFDNPEFQRVHSYLMDQTLTREELIDEETGSLSVSASVKTKGVFAGLVAHVGGVDYHFGTGGIHGSVKAQHIRAGNSRLLRDIDVASLYPSIAIVNRLYPEHLGEAFITAYAALPAERKEWQKKKGKKCNEANSLKLGGNGAYGKSNDPFSFLFDPKFTMTITVNGQLLIAMLIEKLVTVPTLQVIQANTDGVTYIIEPEFEQYAAQICREWEKFTCLTLEDANYSDMWIRDVNNYIARGTDGTLKQKGAYWHPESGDRYAASISEAQPPAWHKDLSNLVSIKAAVAAMVHGIDPATFIQLHSDPFDFVLRAKVGKADRLTLGGQEIQKTSRYYVAKVGQTLTKVSPPPEGYEIGQFKRASKIADREYSRIMAEIGPGVWDARIHTKNQKRYEMRTSDFVSGWKACECNDMLSFDFNNVDFDYYINEARKLIIGA